VPSGKRARITPVKVREYDVALYCVAQRVVGYKVECPCGYKSNLRPTVGSGRIALKQHRSKGCPLVKAGLV